MFKLLRPHDQIQKIRYFTALSSGGKSQDQLAYLKAIETLPLVNVVRGRYKNKSVKCLVHPACTVADKDRFFSTQEEKRTDVNIAVSMLDDAYQNLCDHLIVVSGDSAPLNLLRHAQLPASIPDGSGGFITKLTSW